MSAHVLDAVSSTGVKNARDKLIVALDVSTAEAARRLVSQLKASAGMFKVGLQLFTAEGPGLVRELVGSGHSIFLDLKFHDIPNTVSHAVRSAASLGVNMLTVHAGAGAEALHAAVEAAGDRVSVVAVTVLTSFDDDDLHQIGV